MQLFEKTVVHSPMLHCPHRRLASVTLTFRLLLPIVAGTTTTALVAALIPLVAHGFSEHLVAPHRLELTLVVHVLLMPIATLALVLTLLLSVDVRSVVLLRSRKG